MKIIAIQNKYETLCGEVLEHNETLCSIYKLEDRIRYVEACLKILKELMKYCVLKLSESLAELNKDMGDFTLALGYFKRLLEIREEYFGKNHPEVAIVLEKMAMCYKGMGKKDEAEKLEKRARQIRTK